MGESGIDPRILPVGCGSRHDDGEPATAVAGTQVTAPLGAS
jgi:hypothetical protein